MWRRFWLAFLLGFPLAVALTGLIAWSLPGRWQATLVPAFIPLLPFWVAIIACAVLWRSTWQTLWRLLGLNALAFAVLWLLKTVAI